MDSNYSFQPSYRCYPNETSNFLYEQHQPPGNQPNRSFENTQSGYGYVSTPPAPFLPPCETYFTPPPMALEVPMYSAEEYDEYDEKLLAYKRFKRNDALINNIMSPTIVSSGIPIMETKLKTMRQQVLALETCLKKEKAEIKELEKKNASALEELLNRRDQFDKIYRKLSRPITEPQITKFSNYIYDRLRARRLEKQKLLESLEQAGQEQPNMEDEEVQEIMTQKQDEINMEECSDKEDLNSHDKTFANLLN